MFLWMNVFYVKCKISLRFAAAWDTSDEFVIDLLPITFRSVSVVGLERPRGSRPKTHEAEATTHETEAKAEATTHEAEAKAEARFFGLEAEARPRGLTSLVIGILFDWWDTLFWYESSEVVQFF